MSVNVEQGTFVTNSDSYELDFDSSLFPASQVAPVIVVNALGVNGNYNVYISSLVAVGGSWRATFGISGKPDGNISVAYRAMTRTI